MAPTPDFPYSRFLLFFVVVFVRLFVCLFAFSGSLKVCTYQIFPTIFGSIIYFELYKVCKVHMYDF